MITQIDLYNALLRNLNENAVLSGDAETFSESIKDIESFSESIKKSMPKSI